MKHQFVLATCIFLLTGCGDAFSGAPPQSVQTNPNESVQIREIQIELRQINAELKTLRVDLIDLNMKQDSAGRRRDFERVTALSDPILATRNRIESQTQRLYRLQKQLIELMDAAPPDAR